MLLIILLFITISIVVLCLANKEKCSLENKEFFDVNEKLEIILQKMGGCLTFEQLETGKVWAYEVIEPTIKTECWLSLKHQIDEIYYKTKNNIIFKATNDGK